jgi:hypothetical protein
MIGMAFGWIGATALASVVRNPNSFLVKERRVPGLPSLTNIVSIISKEWICWLGVGGKRLTSIGVGNPDQLGELLGAERPLAWLSGDITADRTPALRHYLVWELEITEVTPETLIPRMQRAFLERQPDDWIVDLYAFLAGQPALLRQPRVRELPLVRLEDGSQVPAFAGGQAQAFLPGSGETAFPTARRTLCLHEPVRRFLQTLGLTEPDPVDDVIRNILPTYRQQSVALEKYGADIERILTAYNTDSKGQQEKLLSALRE